MRDWSNGNTPEIGWNMGRVRSTKTCNIFETLQDKTNYYDGLIGSHIRLSIDTLNDLNSRNVTLAEIKNFYGAQQKNVNEDRPILSAAKCTPMILVS